MNSNNVAVEKIKNIPFFKPSIDNKEIDKIKESLEDLSLSVIDEYESEIKKYFNAKFAISTNNGTSAMHLALCAMDIKRGDRIICSVNSFPNVAEVIRHFDAEPIFVDINEDDFNINIESFQKVLKDKNNKKLRAAFITHVAGQSADMDKIYEIAKDADIKIIDNANKAIGLTYKDQKIGSLKDTFISCFQINPHTYNTIATSGFMITTDEEINDRAKLLRNNALISQKVDKFGNISYIYDVVDIGQKYNLNGIDAAFSLIQLQKNDTFIQKRKEIAKIYDEELKDIAAIKLPKVNKDHIYSQYIIKVNKNRDSFARELAEFGINSSLHYIPLHLLSYYKQKYGLKITDFPTALKVYGQILSLPIYAAMSEDDAHYVCDKIKQICKNRI